MVVKQPPFSLVGCFVATVLLTAIQNTAVEGFSAASWTRVIASNPRAPLSRFSSTSSITTTSSESTSSSSSRWDSFDYLQHWYPVSWDCDLLPNQPTKVTLFDIDYVIAKDRHGNLTALVDKCPHKAAALSEGRITSSGFLQCAYHGWSFDSQGNCRQVPQAAAKTRNSISGGSPKFPAKMCATAVPIRLHQGMLWLWPGPILSNQEDFPTPPTVPELDLPGWKAVRVVRDFPIVDWSLLMSNILDPDHGMFAHQAAAFDMYTANVQNPQRLEEDFSNRGWSMKIKVPAVDKLLAYDREQRQARGLIKAKKAKNARNNRTASEENVVMATSVFEAPSTAVLCRRQADGSTKFVSVFYVCPTGTGRSRFFSAAVSSAMPIRIPRWIFQINLNGFLDQDTVLVASQQPPVLTAEAEGTAAPRKSLYAYASPTDKSVRLLDQFWDATLSRAPNRQASLQALYQAGRLQHTPPREVVLDRDVQHLKICPDSQAFVANCRRIRSASFAVVLASVVTALVKQRIFLAGRWKMAMVLPMVLGTFTAWAAESLRRTFYFSKTTASRDKDLKTIPIKSWLDPQ